METVQNVANAASKIIWGEGNNTQANETGGQEPISGSQGKGTIEEPFDKGNSENPTDPTNASTGTNTSKMSETNTASSIPKNPDNAAAGGGPTPLKDTDKTGVSSDSNATSDPQNTGGNPSNSANNPGAAPSSGGAPFQKQQGADKPHAAPTGNEEGAVKGSKDDAEEILKKRDPDDHSGEPMKMHDGSEGVPKTQEERRSSKAGNPGGQEHGKPEKGTGEQYVKSSGLAADGGDFDATKPGAGREAERLLEEKGIHRGEEGGPTTTADPSSSDNKEKVPLGEKIKTKLHIGSKDK